MGISRIDFGGTTLIDLTNDSVTPETLDKGITAHNSAGDQIVGTRESTVIPVEKDVNFWDYDGTLLHSYTLDEVQSLTELPPAPTPKKEFLVFDEWNWTLEQIKSFGDIVDVGAVYTTNDGNTRLVVDVWDEVVKTTTLTIKIFGNVTVEWGDGAQTALTTTGVNTITHKYEAVGEYTITLSHGNKTFDLGNVNDLSLMGQTSSNYNTTLKAAYLGTTVRCTTNAMRNCLHLETVTIPKNTITQLWSRAFNNCRNLKFVVIPSQHKTFTDNIFNNASQVDLVSMPYGFTTVGYACFSNMPSLRRFVCPQNISFASETFSNNYSLKKIVAVSGLTALPASFAPQAFSLREITIPATVTSIGNSALYNLLSLRKLRFLPTIPPTVSNSSAFGVFPTECVVEVPKASLETYKTATNYGTIAAQMVGV